MQDLDQFFSEADDPVALFNAFALRHELAKKAQADHICYKCGSSQSFESLRGMFESESAYIFQSIISHRRIAYIRFKEDIQTKLGHISYLELSDQKPDGSQHEGFDHIEVYPIGITYDEMVTLLAQTEQIVKVERPHHTTHDVAIAEGFLFRCTQEPLIDKIKRTEML